MAVVSNHELTLIDSDKIAIWIGLCPRIGQEDQLSHLAPQSMGLAVAKKKSIDTSWRQTGKRPSGGTGELAFRSSQAQSFEALYGSLGAMQIHHPACSLHVDTKASHFHHALPVEEQVHDDER